MQSQKIIHNTAPNYNPWHINIISHKDFRKLENKELLLYLLKFAVLAPSTHNTQPWQFAVDPGKMEISIFLDKRKVLPASDIVGRQSGISIGCALENIIVASEYFELNNKITYTPAKDIRPLQSHKTKNNTNALILLCRVTFNKNKQDTRKAIKSKKLINAIKERRVDRSEYDPNIPIPKKLIDDLSKCADNKIVRLHLISDPLRKLALAEFQAQADGYVINNKKFSRELGDWLLPNDTDSFVGMPGIGFGMQDKEALRIHKGLTGESHMEAEDGLKFALGGKIGIEKAPIVGVLSVQKDNPEHWVKAGRVFQQIFLLLTADGFSLAVHAGIAEVALINRIFATSLGTTRRIVLVFRCGKPLNSINTRNEHSPRLPAEDVVIDKP